MQITRLQSRIFAFGILALFFVLAFLLSSHNKSNVQSGGAPPDQAATPGNQEQANAAFMLKDFHRSETRDGRTVWEVNSPRGQYFPQTNSAQVQEAVVHLYKKDGAVVEMRAGEALLELDGAALKKVNAKGGVMIIYNNEVTIDTAAAVYDKESNKVIAPGLVKISSATLDTTGTGLTADLSAQTARLDKQVQSVIKAREEVHVKKK